MRGGRRLSLLVGFASLAAVLGVAMHFTDANDFVGLAEHAAPRWLAIAIGLQIATYPVTALVWWSIARAAHAQLRLGDATGIALAKLFVDQALPWGGISGSVMLADALAARGLRRPVVAATIAIGVASYYAAYAVAVAAALAIALATGHAPRIIVVASVVFVGLDLVVVLVTFALARGRVSVHARIPLLGRFARWVAESDRCLTGDRVLVVRVVAWQLAVFALDATTLWTLVRAVGADAPVAGVYASFMVSSLFRTTSIIPGGFGVFEGSSIVTLHEIGVPTAAALSATLLFRALSYWLPMIPGVIASRRMRRAQALRAPPVPPMACAMHICSPWRSSGSSSESTSRRSRFGPWTMRWRSPATPAHR